MPNADDQTVFDSDVGFDDAENRVEDEGVGDDEIEAFGIERGGRLAHAVADDFAASEFDFVSITPALGNQVAFDLDEEFGVGQADAVAHSGTEHLSILAA